MTRNERLRAALCGLAACALCGVGSPARAHGLYIFAWLEGDRVCSESYFSRTIKVRDGAVSVRDAAGALLAEGRTDAGGLWCFSAPDPQDLTLTINAGQGHRAEFVLPAASFIVAPPAPTAPTAVYGPTWRDIVGGMGWIVGLAGLAAWIRARRGA